MKTFSLTSSLVCVSFKFEINENFLFQFLFELDGLNLDFQNSFFYKYIYFSIAKFYY